MWVYVCMCACVMVSVRVCVCAYVCTFACACVVYGSTSCMGPLVRVHYACHTCWIFY